MHLGRIVLVVVLCVGGCRLSYGQLPAPLFSTYLGGRGADSALAVAVDAEGNVLVGGATMSPNFPVLNAQQRDCYASGQSTCSDAFLTKFTPDGRQTVYSTFLGGMENDRITAIAVDSAGYAYVAGVMRGGAMVARFNPAGGLMYKTLLEGAMTRANAIAVDPDGNAYVTGETSSRTFFVNSPIQTAAGSDSCTVAGSSYPIDAFIAKISVQGGIMYSTYLGGSGNDFGRAIAVDDDGYAYVAGTTSSKDFPVVNALQAANAGGASQTPGACTGGDAFVVKVDQLGRALMFSTYLGGGGLDDAKSIALDGNGRIVIAGSTSSTDLRLNRPLRNQPGGGFLARIENDGSAVTDSTYLASTVSAMALNAVGQTYLAGTGLTKLDATWSSILLERQVQGNGVALAVGHNNIYASGTTQSLDPVNAFQSISGGGDDAFLTAIADPLTASTPVVVSSAANRGPAVAPDSIATMYGVGLAGDTRAAQVSKTVPLPETLADVQVMVTDSAGTARHASLYFVSPGQINFVVPAGAASGRASVDVLRAGTLLTSTKVEIAPAAPGVYTADSSGGGVAAGVATRIRADGTITWRVTSLCDTNHCIPIPIDMRTATDTIVVSLFGTGFRNARDFHAEIAGQTAEVKYAGPQSEYPAFDQINLLVPQALAGRRIVRVRLTADGTPANTVELDLQ